MAQEYSFDIVSKVDLQELDNAINQVRKELLTRYDFKGSRSRIDFDKIKEPVITLLADDTMKLRSLKEMLHEKMAKRSVSIRALDYQAEAQAEGGSIRQVVKIIQGISSDDARRINKLIKELKLKVQSSIQGDVVRVKAKSKDDLQMVMHNIKSSEEKLALQFTNFR